MTESNNLTGQTIGRYQLLEQLGQGGMAEVYKAHQPSLDRYVAIKVMHAFLAREEGFLARFQREAKNVAALQHPNIIQVFDFDVHNGMPYMVMEFIEGTTLKTHLENLDRRGQTLAFGEAVHIVREVGKALAYAHQRSMIHRDVKPANVLMGAGGRVILTDFGIAKILTGPSLTATGSTIGTPAYMSPEQSLGKPGDHRSDLYSLGVMLYQLATSQLPYDADTPLAVMLKHVNEPLPMPRSVRPDMPESLERIILKSMAKSPDDRFQSADEMLAALDRPEMVAPARARPAAPQPQSATVAVNTAPAAPPASRAGAGTRPWLISLIGLMIGMALCLVLGVGAFALRGRLAALFPPAVTSGPGVTSTAPPTRLLATQQPDTPVPDNVTNTPDVGPVVGATQKVCAVSDTSGFADRSFNQRAYDGLLSVESKLGWDVTTLEAQSGEDYFPHLATFVNSECGLIVAVGFTMADAVSAVAQAHPDQKLLILDHMYDQDHANVWQAVYAVDQASFLAGYAAAAASKTGAVGTFGGLNIPPVVDFMDGFALGVNYYNQKHAAKVQVLGWDPTAPEDGTFIGNFNSTDDGYTAAARMMEQGADVIFPVAGPAGFGAAKAVLENGSVYVIGVDSDWVVTAPEYSSVILTSVVKQMDATVLQAAEAVQAGTFTGGVHVGTLENGGVGLAPFYDNQSLIPVEVQKELFDLQTEIVAGRLATKP